jgi:protein-disulfide isomerase
MEKAPVVIVEYSDFECAYCRRNRELIRDLESRYPDLLRVIHRHFPLDPACNEAVEQSIHPRACRAAEAAECAALQNRYSEMADVLFENQDRLFESNLERLATRAGLDPERFRACLSSRETLAKIVADTRAGRALELTSTPTLFFNGRRVKGTLADAAKYDLAVMIEARIAAGDTLAGAPEPSSDPK